MIGWKRTKEQKRITKKRCQKRCDEKIWRRQHLMRRIRSYLKDGYSIRYVWDTFGISGLSDSSTGFFTWRRNTLTGKIQRLDKKSAEILNYK